MSGSSDEGDSGKAAPAAGSADATPRREMSSHATPPVELEVREVVGEDALGIWARQLIQRGTRYGPFLGKWLSEPVDPRFAWEVRLATTGTHGFLDGTNEYNNWLKLVRASPVPGAHNLRTVLLVGQLFYETSRDVVAGEELTVGPKEPLKLELMPEMAAAGTSEDRSDRETESQHSGTLEEERFEADDEEGEIRCVLCSKDFPDYDQLDEHLVTNHRYSNEQHKCDSCPRTFPWRASLLRHRTLHHELRRYPCENCPKLFSDPSNLQRHIRAHHVGARSHACSECGKTFATSSGLKQHTHIHSSVKPFQCEVCFKAYTQFSNLCRHKRMHADCRMQIKCVKCGQSFSTVTSLSKHKRFCDSTSGNNSPALGAGLQALQHPSAMQHSQPSVANPFLMYPRPTAGLSFYPPSILSPYPTLFHPNAAANHPATSFLNTPLLFTQQAKSIDEDSIINKNENKGPPVSPSTEVEIENDESKLSNGSAAISINISPNEESISSKSISRSYSQLPPPALMPPQQTLTTAPSSQRSSDIEEDVEKVDNDLGNDLTLNRKIEHSPKSNVTSSTSCEQPLDLRIQRKRGNETRNGTDKIDEVKIEPQLKRQKNDSKHLISKGFPNSINLVQNKQVSPINEKITNNLSKLTTTMAYPRPIHPMFLEAMYRPTYANFSPSPGPGHDRLLPPPPPPFGPNRGFPFLGSLVNGLNNGHARAPFDLLRPQIPNFGSGKAYPDVVGPHVGNSPVIPGVGPGPGPAGKLKDRYACKYCGKVFPRSANLTRHLRTHTGEQPYKCKYCERSFSISSNLQRHVRNIHNKEKPFKCPLCERCFGQQTNLDRHLKKHEADDGSGVVSVADSPGSSNENEREDAYFDEIRTFMGKVTYSGSGLNIQTHLYTPHNLHTMLDPGGKEEEDSEPLSEEPDPDSVSFEINVKSENPDEPISSNNNSYTTEQEAIQVVT